MLHWVKSGGGQVAYMAPTTLLAIQVASKLKAFLELYNITSTLLLGSVPAKEKKAIKTALANGELHIVVGTHALIQEDVKFQKLSYVIIDEQHRFGVEQREKLTEYSSSTEVNSLQFTVYSDEEMKNAPISEN